MTIRTRFAPSPTGRIHFGNVRAVLASVLYAKQNHGQFVLRMEDTDVVRSTEEYAAFLQDDLKWLSIEWQEGPDISGPYHPYWQSQRQSIYDSYYKKLQELELIYPCFCTDQELNLSRKLLLSRGEPPRYTGTCTHLTKQNIEEKLAAGNLAAWRFKVPHNTAIEFTDLIRGIQQFQSNDIGDFIVRRADTTAPFLFCNAIDDALMQISHVLRGEDHVANTPRQILILTALGLAIPQYGHISLITGSDGAPLSKRHGSFSVHELQAAGYLPIAIVNYLARLGQTFESSQLLSFDELANAFQINKISRAPVRFDLNQLLHWQKMAVQALSNENMLNWLGEKIVHQIPEHAYDLFLNTMRHNILFPIEAGEWVHILFAPEVILSAEAKMILQEAGEQYFVTAESAVDQYGLQLDQVMKEIKNTLNLSGKRLFLPFRIALSGKHAGPELIHLAELLGLKRVKHRISQAFQYTVTNT